MVKKLIKLFYKDTNGLHEAAFLLGASAFLSQILALVRDRLFASTFGANQLLDVYYASFRLPDILFVFVASLVSGSVLIPAIIHKKESLSHDDFNNFLNSVLTVFLVLLISVAVVVSFFLPEIANILVPGFSESARAEYILLTRILLLQPIFLGLSNIFNSVAQAHKRFFVYALAPILYNVGIIIGILFFYNQFGITGLALGVLLGAFLHFIIQIPVALSFPWRPGLMRKPVWQEVRQIAGLSLPRTVTLGTQQAVIIIFTALASFLGVGAVSVFNLAYNLQSVPLAIIGVSYSLAAFPTLAELYSSGDRKRFAQKIATAGNYIIFWSLPVLALVVILRAHLVRIILGAGQFSWTDTRLAAAALALFTFSVVAQGLILLFVRGYYAAGLTQKPLLVNVFSSLVAVFSAFFLLDLFKESLEFRLFFETLFRVEDVPGTQMLMLPLAFSIGTILSLILHWTLFRRDFVDCYISMRKSFFQNAFSAGIMGYVAYTLLRIFEPVFDITTFVGLFLHGFTAGIAGLAAGAGFLWLVKNEEFLALVEVIRKKQKGSKQP